MYISFILMYAGSHIHTVYSASKSGPLFNSIRKKPHICHCVVYIKYGNIISSSETLSRGDQREQRMCMSPPPHQATMRGKRDGAVRRVEGERLVAVESNEELDSRGGAVSRAENRASTGV